jgi:hypothetical protein
MIKKKIIALILLLVIIEISFLGYYKYSIDKNNNFIVNTILLKSVIKQGEKVVNDLKITNTNSLEKNFQINVKEIGNLVSLSEDNFNLKPEEVKNIQITFEDKNLQYEPGVYVGKIVVNADSSEKEIPVIFEIQTQQVLVTTILDVSPKYKELAPGEKSVTEVRFVSMDTQNINPVEMTYLIKNFDGGIIVSEVENIMVGSESRISKTILLPEDIESGDYVFIAITKYENSVSTSSYLFNIKKRNEMTTFDRLNYITILIFLFLFGIILLVFYMIYEKIKLSSQSKRQQGTGLRTNTSKFPLSSAT